MAFAPTFDNKFLMLHNALPSCTLEDLYRKAGIDLPSRKRRQAKQEVFVLDIQWGGGEEHNSHSLFPGKSIRMNEREGKEIAQEYKPQAGLCAREPGLAAFRDDKDRQDALVQALMIAEEHYQICGAQQLDNVRNARSHSEDQVKQYRSSIYGTYFLAMAKEELIREHRLALEGKHKKAS